MKLAMDIFYGVVLMAALFVICVVVAGCDVSLPCDSKFRSGQVVRHKVMNRDYVVLEICKGLKRNQLFVRSESGFADILYETEVEAK